MLVVYVGLGCCPFVGVVFDVCCFALCMRSVLPLPHGAVG